MQLRGVMFYGTSLQMFGKFYLKMRVNFTKTAVKFTPFKLVNFIKTWPYLQVLTSKIY